MKTIQITFFAGLKDFFGDKIEIQLPYSYSKDDVIDALSAVNVKALDLLNYSRFATEEAFLDMDAQMNAQQLFILPPSSGG